MPWNGYCWYTPIEIPPEPPVDHESPDAQRRDEIFDILTNPTLTPEQAYEKINEFRGIDPETDKIVLGTQEVLMNEIMGVEMTPLEEAMRGGYEPEINVAALTHDELMGMVGETGEDEDFWKELFK